MADMTRLENALRAADAAGNADDARAIAAEILRMRSQQVAQQQTEQAQSHKETGMLEQLGGAAAATGAGLLKGAADIGATLLTPFDVAGLSGYTPEQRRAKLEEFASQFNRPAFTAGEIASQIAGSMGAPKAVATGVGKLAPRVPEMARAIEGGGFGKGLTLAQRLAGGGVAGGATAGLINPEDAGTGAGVGVALPGGAAVAQSIPKVAGAIVGLKTGVGSTPLKEAYKAGKAGGAQAEAFRKNISGDANMMDALETAKGALDDLRVARSAQYKQGIGEAMKDPATLNFKPIDEAFDKALNTVTVKGKEGKYFTIGKQEQNTIGEVKDILDEWKADPSRWNVEGLDALKRRIGAVYPESPKQTQAQRVIDSMYNAVKKEIERQAPNYSSTMKDYSKMTDQIREIESSLSLGKKASADTAMRKLQSLMRDNVSTNYGARTKSAEQLFGYGGEEVMPSLAGQALSELVPRGVQRATAGASPFLSFLAGGPVAAGVDVALSSPRLMGETAYGAGLASRGINRLSDLLESQGALPSGSLTRAAIINAMSR